MTAFGQTVGGPDDFGNLIRAAASFDMDSPVEARAEFDPPEGVVGGRILYRVSVTALDESFELPEHLVTPNGLVLESGGRGQNYEPTGGNKIRPRTTIIYHATLTTNGTLTIPAFQAMAYGKPLEIPAATIKVAAAGEGTPIPPPLLLAEPPSGDVYVGQAVTIPLALTQESPHPIPVLSEAKVTGQSIFSEQFVSPMRQANVQRNGASIPANIEDVTFTALRAGPQKLAGQAFTYLLEPVPGQTAVQQTVNQLVDSEPFTLDVKPLPSEGQLPGFNGAVGSYQVDPPTLSADEVKAGEPVTLAVIIHGGANIGRIAPPPPPSDPGWQTFPATGENLPPDVAHQLGAVRFMYTMIPLNAKIKGTPTIPFSAFDPDAGKYVDLTVPSVPVTINAAAVGLTAQTPSSPATLAAAQANASTSEKAPVFIGLTKRPGFAFGSLAPIEMRWWFGAVQLVPLVSLAGLWLRDRRRRFLREHPEVILKARARRGLRRQLKLARRAAAARDAVGFARGAASAFREACAPYGAANPSALVCADILQALPTPELQGRGAESVRRLFAAADAMNFGGPTREGSELLSLQPELERLLQELKERL